MPIRINATQRRDSNNSSNSTKPRRFNRSSFKGGQRSFNSSKRPAPAPVHTFEQRNSIGAHINYAQTNLIDAKKKAISSNDWNTLNVSQKHITMRTPARHRQMINRSQNQFNALAENQVKKVSITLPTVCEVLTPTGVWGKPLPSAVKDDVSFELRSVIETEDNDDSMVPLGPLNSLPTLSWGDAAMDYDETDDDETDDDMEIVLDNQGRPMTDDSAW